jgi:hypothetical protein
VFQQQQLMSDFSNYDRDSHYDDWEWLDLARDLLQGERASRMHAHLASGCSQCTEVYGIWRSVLVLARKEADSAPPEDVVNSMKAAFSIARRLPFLVRIAQVIPLVFDNFREPLPAGVRGGALRVRNLMYESGEYILHLRLEKDAETGALVAGHVLHKGGTQEAAAHTDVLAVQDGTRIAAFASTSSAGEFQLEVEGLGAFSLYLNFPDATFKRIDLPGVQ